MTTTLLLDLDDTLINTDINTFIPAYSRALAKHLSAYVEPQRLIQALMASIDSMLKNQALDRTLLQNFEAVFYPAIGLEKESVRDLIDSFYREVFPTLRSLTQPIPEAVQMVKEAFQNGYRVGIATNPLFPRTAILQRMEWAGLAVDQYPFILVPSIETFHFAKPNPDFFSEYLAHLGWPEGPVAMVGNDLENDVIASHQMGLAAFWIHPQVEAAAHLDSPNATGGQQEVLPWLAHLSEDEFQPDYSSPTALLSTLRSTPAYLQSLSTDLPPDAWLKTPKPGEWCLAEIVCHLRDVDNEVNLPRLRKILKDSNPFLPGMDTDPWAKERQYISQDCLQALDAFILARKELLSYLGVIQPADWSRTARHAILGPTQLREIINIIASHDRLHIQQAQQAINTPRLL